MTRNGVALEFGHHSSGLLEMLFLFVGLTDAPVYVCGPQMVAQSNTEDGHQIAEHRLGDDGVFHRFFRVDRLTGERGVLISHRGSNHSCYARVAPGNGLIQQL